MEIAAHKARRMKDSGIEWIGEIPEDWIVSTIKREYEFQTGWTPDTKNSDNFVGDNIWVNISDMKNRVIYDSVNHISNDAVLNSSMNVSPKGSLMYAFKLSVGAVSFCGNDMYTNEAIATFLPGKNSLRYLYYIAPVFIIENANENIYGAKLLNQQLIKNAKIVLPVIEEQEKISNYLDSKCSKIDFIIEKQEAVIEKLQAYKQSLITEAVTKGLDADVEMKDSGVEWIGEIPKHWGVVRIKDICDFNPSTRKVISADDIVSYAPMECVQRGVLLSKEIQVSNLSTGLTYFENNDIIMAKVTPCFENGNIAIADNLINEIGFGSSELFVFRVSDSQIKWLFYFLQNSVFKNLAISTMTGVGGLKRVSPTFVKNYKLGFPPLEEQQQIADYLDSKCSSIDASIAKKKLLIEKLKAYKKSLIYEVVTGKKEV